MSKTKDFGELGESYSCRFLKDKGYEILERNFRTKYGEIDIIAMDGNTLVFVEVKARISTKYGRPEEAVTSRKIKNIKRAAEYYILLNSKRPGKFRIDVVSLIVSDRKLQEAKIIKLV